MPSAKLLSMHRDLMEGRLTSFSTTGMFFQMQFQFTYSFAATTGKGHIREDNSDESDEAPAPLKRLKMKHTPKTTGDGPREDQLSFYKGDKRLAIEYACAFFRIYLATVNPFPSSRDLLELPRKFFKMACDRIIKSCTTTGMSLHLLHPPSSTRSC